MVCKKKKMENIWLFIPGYAWVQGYRPMTESGIVQQSEGRRGSGLLWGKSSGTGLVIGKPKSLRAGS